MGFLPAATPDPNNQYDKCDHGRHLTRRCVGLTQDPADTYCPAGSFVIFQPMERDLAVDVSNLCNISI